MAGILKFSVFAGCIWLGVAFAQPIPPSTPAALQADWETYHYPLKGMVEKLQEELYNQIPKWKSAQQRNKALVAVRDERDELENQLAGAEIVVQALLLGRLAATPSGSTEITIRLREICQSSRRLWRSGSSIARGPKVEAESLALNVNVAREAISDERLLGLVVESIEMRFRSSRNLLELCQKAIRSKN